MKKLIILFTLLFSISLFSHPMPNSVIALNVYSKTIGCEVRLPLNELQFALPFDVTKNTTNLIKDYQNELEKYIISHFNITGKNEENWSMKIDKMYILENEQVATGKYRELVVMITISPLNPHDIRKFSINYDVIMHQVVTHKALVTVSQDWVNGKIDESDTYIGTISINIDTNKVTPFKVNLSQGSIWKGFKSMVSFGMKHIYEGTDHLLFLFVLLLSTPLIIEGRQWGGAGTIKYTLIRVIRIVTAFTIGHTITLIIGSFELICLNVKLVEILIALSILFTAIHSIKPIFPNKEMLIASFFGFIHGLAFADILIGLHLESSMLLIGLLGFNIGIELVQILLIILIIPWFLIIRLLDIYKWIRIVFAIFASIASLGWLFERYTGKANFVSIYIQNIQVIFYLFASTLVIFTIINFIIVKRKIN